MEDGYFRVKSYGNTVMFSGDINTESADALIEVVMETAEIGKGLTLFLNSHGGDLFESVRLCDWFWGEDDNWEVIINGMCASGASLVAMAFRKRTMTPNSWYMMHELKIMPTDSTLRMNEFEADYEHNKGMHEQMVRIYCKASANDVGSVNRYLSLGKYMDAKTALKLGYITHIRGVER